MIRNKLNTYYLILENTTVIKKIRIPIIETIFKGKPKIKYSMAEIKTPVKIPKKAFFTIRLEPLPKMRAMIIINVITIITVNVSLFNSSLKIY